MKTKTVRTGTDALTMGIGPEKTSLLFVCLGNICRSPAAEAVMKAKLAERGIGEDKVRVDSAGIGAWHVGQLPDSRMRAHGLRRGYRIDSRARQVRTADFDRFDYIFAMDHENVSNLMRLARNDSDRKKILCTADFMTRHPGRDTVPDPYYGGDSGFELALDLIEDACDGILDRLFPSDSQASTAASTARKA